MLHHKVPVCEESGRIVKWYGSSIDIEDRKRAEHEIREQETELRQILDLTPQHIGVFGPDGTPLYVNHIGVEYFGVDMDQCEPKGLDLISFLQMIVNSFWKPITRRYGTGRP